MNEPNYVVIWDTNCALPPSMESPVANPRAWDRSDPLEDAIWRLCDYLQADLDWNLTDAGYGGIPAPDELFPHAVRTVMRPLIGDGLRRARIEALRAELERLTAPEHGEPSDG